MAEIDTANIMPTRTRGVKIDFAKAAAQNPETEEDDEEDDDYVAAEDDHEQAESAACHDADKMNED
jgi:hypothetical protein